MAAIPTLTPLPSPALSTDTEDVFNSKADATLIAQQTFVNVDMNTKVIPGINAAVTTIDGYRQAAAQSAQTATEQAAIATNAGSDMSAQIAQAKAYSDNAAASAIAAEAAPGSIGNLALIQATALLF